MHSKKLCNNAQELNNFWENMDQTVYEKVNSFNGINYILPDTEIIIVGTITPSGGNGYFYTAPRNKIYGYIDAARGTKLKEKKEALQKTTNEKQRLSIIDGIKRELNDQKIAFLDVIDEAIRRKGSYADTAIKHYTLDYAAFSNIPQSVRKVICNSRLTENCYNKIRVETTNLTTAIYLSQRSGKKNRWINELK